MTAQQGARSLRPGHPGSIVLLAAVFVPGTGGLAWAHATGRGFVLLLPTHLYIISGAFVVGVTFLLMAALPSIAGMLERGRRTIVTIPVPSPLPTSLVVLAFLAAMIVAGYRGSPQPNDNPLPNVVWSLWWVGFVFLHLLAGNVWAYLNPWVGLYWLLTLPPGLRRLRRAPLLRYPAGLGYWPAVALLFAFGWLELIYPAPADPERLANAVLVYVAITAAAMLLFGDKAWLERGETFSLYFRMISWLSPVGVEKLPDEGSGRPRSRIMLTIPGTNLLRTGGLPASGVVFVLLALSMVSFDGLSKTFWWLTLIGINPLEHPGRSGVIGVNTFGMMATFAIMAAAYLAAVILGHVLARDIRGSGDALRRLVVAIVPIALGYHVAHYLPQFFLDVQWAARSLSDPYALGWDLFGTRDIYVSGWMLTTYHGIRLIWNIQAFVIIFAHVIGIVASHVIEMRSSQSLRSAIISQIPMTALMIAYTVFGLWLLASPTVG